MKKKTINEEKNKWRINYEEKPQVKKKTTSEENHKRRNILLRKKTQMKKTNVENIEEITHEIEFMLFSHFAHSN